MMADLEVPLAFITALSEQSAGLRFGVRRTPFLIGRGDSCDLQIAGDPRVSRQHCAIHRVGTSLSVEVLGNPDGMLLNGHRVEGRVPLPIPSWLLVGSTRLAILPSRAEGEEPLTHLADSLYATGGSIIIPPTASFQERTEAFLVVDIVGSTSVLSQGEIHLSKVVAILGQVLERELRAESEPFLKCTGDGFFACFSDADRALDAAMALGPGVARYAAAQIRLSTVLHWGTARLTAGGDRTGKDVHGAFSLDELRRREPDVRAYIEAPDARQLILLSEKFWFEMSHERRLQTEPLGYFSLKGFDAPERVFRWLGPGA